MADSKAVAVVTEGLKVLRGEQRIFFAGGRGTRGRGDGGAVYLRILSMSGSVCLPRAHRSTCVIYCKRRSMRI